MHAFLEDTSLRLRKERMWKSYHCLRTSVTFCKDWKEFLYNSIGHQANPIFFQFVSLTVFKELIKVEFPIPPSDIAEHPDRPLTFEEQNAIQFVAGYICRKVRRR